MVLRSSHSTGKYTTCCHWARIRTSLPHDFRDEKHWPLTAEYHGSQAQSVLDVLKQRKLNAYRPSLDDDGNRVALMFEGGAMGGLLSGAAGTEVANLGYSGVFDTVYGTSSGALNAVYFVAGQANALLDVYRIDAIDPAFMRVLRWPDQVDVKWLANRISQPGPRHLNVPRVMESLSELKISTTDAETGKTRYFSNRSDPAGTIIPAVVASSCTPMFVTHREIIEGKAYTDGLVRAALQTQAVVGDGHTHVLALLSNPVGRRKTSPVFRSFLEHVLRIRRYPTEFQTAFRARAAFYNDALDLLHSGEPNFSSLVICPHKTDPHVGNLEKNEAVLNAAIEAQQQRVRSIFGETATYRAIQDSDKYIE